MRFSQRHFVGLLGLLALVWGAVVWVSAAPARLAPAPSAVATEEPAVVSTGQPITARPAPSAASQTCLDCHSGPETARMASFHTECSTCHVDSARHVSDPVAGNVSTPAATDCLTCHTKSAKLSHWEDGPHSRNKISCNDCHNPHAPVARTEYTTVGNRRMDTVSRACVSCHQDSAASFNLPSHHPLREGGVSCVSCHDPHGGDTQQQLSKTERCISCHPAQRGPFVFEHAPVIEDCASCHVPHGSANRKLSELPQPSSCLQCHSLPDNRHGQGSTPGARVSGAALRNCVGCHAAIHGSQNDPHLRY